MAGRPRPAARARGRAAPRRRSRPAGLRVRSCRQLGDLPLRLPASGDSDRRLHARADVRLPFADVADLVRKGGNVSIVGVYGPPFNLLNLGTAMNKGLTLRMNQCN